MARKSPFEFDISVSADKRRRAHSRGKSAAVETSTKVCDDPNCDERGVHRAPKSREQLNEFYWFCKKHIREYNLKWNYFEHQSEAEIDQQMESARLGDRPTWNFKTGAAKAQTEGYAEGFAWKRFGYDDPTEVLGDKATINPTARASERRVSRKLPQTERRALTILGGEDTMTKTELRRVYKSLVKDLHPDMNGGDRADEEKLQEVIWAWDQIKGSRSFKP